MLQQLFVSLLVYIYILLCISKGFCKYGKLIFLDKINIKFYNAEEVINMEKTDILSLPKILFAHVHKADRYNTTFSPSDNIIEITYLKQGTLNLIKDDELFTAHEGDIICGIRDKFTVVKSDSFHCHHTVGANVLWTHTDAANALYLPLITRASNATEEISKIIYSFIYEPFLYEDTYAKAATKFMDILYKINSIHQSQIDIDLPKSNMYVIRAKKYIHKNLHKNITQSEIARYLNITPQYLCQIFRKNEGISLIKYINTIKLQQIQFLIENENMKLYEACKLFGYSDANYVSYLYKKMFGRSITNKPTLSKKLISNLE